MRKQIDRLYITLTNQCNMRCPHCWISAGEAHDERKIEFREYKNVIDSLLNYGLKTIKVTGGEPLIKKDLVKSLLAYCNEKSLSFNVETNGLLIDDEYLELFKNAKDIELGLSLDFPNDMHDSFRKFPDAFNIIKNVLIKLNKNNISNSVVMTVHKGNYHFMEQLADLVIGEFGGTFVKYLVCRESGRAETEMLNELLNPSEIINFYKEVIRIAHKYPKKITAMIPTAFQEIDSELIVGTCDFDKIISVLPDGSIALCGIGINNPETVLGKISVDSISNIVENNMLLEKIRSQNKVYTGVCGVCIFNKVCANICPASSYSSYNTYFGPYPICQKLYEAGLFPQEYVIGEAAV
ncbi:radical SAM protein [Clostridium sp. 'deep sea']|uniref:radical SAM/SPASM domain-containing protein n=1 Tax=Clostridium sp. 'deep sea' TaxID=2779445 RepID=UPI0018965A83|nr:radical SAM protein [Clostridium sp. 'deep sea']QOR34619.1 radical SAM protein [Clostridium sp. 'deep sea']